jgi:hypothetical protein
MAPRRYLVIANQTLAEAELTEAIRQRMEAGPSSFFLLVPNTDHGDLAARISRSAPLGAPVADATADQLATEHAQHRLGQLLDDLRAVGAAPRATSGRRTRSRRWTTCWPPGSSTRSSSRPCPSTSRSGSGWIFPTACTATPGCQ